VKGIGKFTLITSQVELLGVVNLDAVILNTHSNFILEILVKIQNLHLMTA
jgi:hypothetical protein